MFEVKLTVQKNTDTIYRVILDMVIINKENDGHHNPTITTNIIFNKVSVK